LAKSHLCLDFGLLEGSVAGDANVRTSLSFQSDDLPDASPHGERALLMFIFLPQFEARKMKKA
jgi:hypothetical protein